MISSLAVAPYEIQLENVPIPEIEPDEVLVKMLQCGICASDMQFYRGLMKRIPFPTTLGHEGVGRIVKTGAQVDSLKEGDLVTVIPLDVCGTCHACTHGKPSACENKNFASYDLDHRGMFREYTTCKAKNAIRLPEGNTYDSGMLAEPCAVGVHAASRAKLLPDDRVLVLGAGIIGNFVAQAAGLSGAEIMIADTIPQKLEIARSHGIAHVVDMSDLEDLDHAVQSTFDKADVIFDCRAKPALFNHAYTNYIANGGTMVVVGNFKDSLTLNMDPLQRKEINLIGSFQHTYEDFLTVVHGFASGTIKYQSMITHRFPIQEIAEAFAFADKHPLETMKVAVMLEQ